MLLFCTVYIYILVFIRICTSKVKAASNGSKCGVANIIGPSLSVKVTCCKEKDIFLSRSKFKDASKEIVVGLLHRLPPVIRRAPGGGAAQGAGQRPGAAEGAGQRPGAGR
jgi:hypothetical protein